MTHVYLYARFSPRPDADSSTSAASQLADLRAHAQRMGWTVAGEETDEAVSGDIWARPGLQSLLKKLKPGDILLAHSVDRIARDTGLLAAVLATVFGRDSQLYTLDAGLVTADDPISKLLTTVLGAVAEFQRSMIRKRSAAAMKRKISSGLITNYPPNIPLPYGYRWINPDRSVDANGRNVEPDEEEAAIREQVQAWHTGGRGYAKIAKTLNLRGVTYRGKEWTRWDVRSIIYPGVRGRRPRKLRY